MQKIGVEMQKDLIDAQKKLNEGGINSTEFMAETYKGKVTGNFVTEYDWAELENAEKEFYSTLKEKYGVKSSEEITDPDTLKDYNEEIAKFYSKYTLSNFKPMVQGVFYMSEAEKFLAQKQQELSPEEYKVWEYFNTKVRDNGSIVILKNKSKQQFSDELNVLAPFSVTITVCFFSKACSNLDITIVF